MSNYECPHCGMTNIDCGWGKFKTPKEIELEARVKELEAKNKKILDVCCGSRMFHFDKKNPNVIFMDIRDFEDTLCDGRKLEIHPDIIADFRNIPFNDNTFNLVIFDPPHLLKVGQNSWLYKKYGKLSETWPTDIKKAFNEISQRMRKIFEERGIKR